MRKLWYSEDITCIKHLYHDIDPKLSFYQQILYLSRFYTLLWSGHNDNTGLVGEALTKYCWPNTPTPWGALVPPLNVTTLVPDSISHTQTFHSCPDVSLVNKIYQQFFSLYKQNLKRTKQSNKWIFKIVSRIEEMNIKMDFPREAHDICM